MDRSETERITIRARLWGIVQGVGFRPYVVKLANRFGLNGFVRNDGGTVDIHITGEKHNIDAFFNILREEGPPASEIVHIELSQKTLREFTGFTIIHSLNGEENGCDAVMLPPDLPVCEDCLLEMKTNSNERYEHPFISCMSCGPRYSIIDRVPYDRCNTSMDAFGMCSFCSQEYTDPANRRFHAQTVSCSKCGPYLIYSNAPGVSLLKADAFRAAAAALKEGKIIAVKGIGGYHLVCSPFTSQTVNSLRSLKGREEKPFAVMFPDLRQIRLYCELSGDEEELLRSKAHPIVLLERKPASLQELSIAPEVYRSSRQLGVFLPYTPLQQLLMETCGPLIMTSANISDLPIITDDASALELISKGVGVLYNTRSVRVGLDDSVTRVIEGKPQLIRRARGFVPLPFYIKNINEIGRYAEKGAFFASGGHLKAAFALTKDNFVYLSQHLGDLDNFDSYRNYADNYSRLCSLLRIEPRHAVCDLHPTWNSTLFTEGLGLPVTRVQHHHAHIASVMAENNISEPVIGISFDGTGFGCDGSIWGGEILVCRGAEFIRAGQLRYCKMTGGDVLAKDAGQVLTCYLIQSGLCDYEAHNPASVSRTEIIKSALREGINTVYSSSMGRLFDAVSCLLGLSQWNSYEGECAILLENFAYKAFKNGVEPIELKFGMDNNIMDFSPVLSDIIDARKRGALPEALSAGFHRAVAVAVRDCCVNIRKETGISACALSGGVFQNRVLTELCLRLLAGSGFKVFINRLFPPNDGGIALGQAFVYLRMEK